MTIRQIQIVKKSEWGEIWQRKAVTISISAVKTFGCKLFSFVVSSSTLQPALHRSKLCSFLVKNTKYQIQNKRYKTWNIRYDIQYVRSSPLLPLGQNWSKFVCYFNFWCKIHIQHYHRIMLQEPHDIPPKSCSISYFQVRRWNATRRMTRWPNNSGPSATIGRASEPASQNTTWVSCF